MIKLPPEETKSLGKPTYPLIKDDLEVDVAIVGGGITGLTSAYLLKKAGLKVAVLEKHNLASGTTGGTTGKVTSQHSLIYADLSRRIGRETAKTYGEANQAAIDKIEQVIKTEKIDCGWQRDDNYAFTAQPDQISKFKEEAKVAAKLGLPASFETQLDLPFEVAGAVKFANQAKIHAKEYVAGLAKAVDGQGSYVFENSEVVGFHDGTPAWVKTRQATVTAKDVIVATKVPAAPLGARAAYCILEYPTTSYIVAGKFNQPLSGMYISLDKGHYSILPMQYGSERVLLIGGENHLPGFPRREVHYRRLAEYAQKHFGVEEIAYKWRAMDYLVYDGVPLIGKMYMWSRHLYTATGFQKWGLSTSMVAATILSDRILGKPNPWASTFTSPRHRPIYNIPRAVINYLKS
jgi:glycine/D-amino acid oxidase-like deaminating enzyme